MCYVSPVWSTGRFIAVLWFLCKRFSLYTFVWFFLHDRKSLLEGKSKWNAYMAKPVLSKSVCSDWFFLGRDFAVRTVSMKTVQGSKPCIFVLEQSRQIQNLQPKQRKKCEYCHSSSRNHQKKLKTLKFTEILKMDEEDEYSPSEVSIILNIWSFWFRNWNVHHREPGGYRRFYQSTEKCKHKQEKGYWYDYSSPLHWS